MRPPAAASSWSCPAASSRTGSRTSSSAAPCTTAYPGVRRAELHLRVGEALEAAGGRSRARRSPTSPITSPPRRRSAASSGRSTTTSLAARAATDVARVRRGGRDARSPRSSWGSTMRRAAGRGAARAGHGQAQGGQGARGARRARRPRRRSPASSTTTELLARAAIGYEEASWRPGDRSRGRWSCSRRRRTALGRRATPSCGSACWPGSRARSTYRASSERGAIVRASAIELARRLDDRVGLGDGARALLLVPRRRPRSNEIIEMLTEARGPRRGARRHRAAGRSDVLAGAGVCSPRRHLVRAHRGGGAAARSPRSPAAVQPPRGRALRRRDRALRRAARRGRADGAPLRAGGTAADRPRRIGHVRDPDVQPPPRAGPARGARAR